MGSIYCEAQVDVSADVAWDYLDRFTRAEVANHFRKSEKWLRRVLPRVRGVTPIQAGSSILFTPADVQLIEAYLRCPCTLAASDKASGTGGARSASAKGKSPSTNTAQDAVRALMQKHKPRPETRRSDRTSFKVVMGGRTA